VLERQDVVIADGGGLRLDAGKPMFELLPPDAELAIVEVFTSGARKYAPRNWERGMEWSKIIGPLRRHINKRLLGEVRDAESGHLHTAHVAWNAIAWLTYELRGIGTNDLPVIRRKEDK